MQLEKVQSKNGFLTWPNMALTKKWDLRAISLSFLRDQTVERERGEEKREEEKRKKEESSQGMESNLEYGFILWNSKVCMNFHAIGWLLVVPKLRIF